MSWFGLLSLGLLSLCCVQRTHRRRQAGQP